MMLFEIVMSGSGGQGILYMGNLLAQAALREGRHVTFMPTYGVAMRGGTANCVVKISSEEIGSPVMERPHAAILMNRQSLDKFESVVRSGGLVIANSSIIDPEAFDHPHEAKVVPVPANHIAREVAQNDRSANIVSLGAFLSFEPIVQAASVEAVLHGSGAPNTVVQKNIAAFRAGLSRQFTTAMPQPHAPSANRSSAVQLEIPTETPAKKETTLPPPEVEVFEVNGYVPPRIDSEKCTTCEECVNINSNIFAYDNRRKAYIKDPHGGPYKHLVRAAEKCSEKIIHPGFPADRSEKGIARLIEKAKKFM
ncbi:MAG TPA: 2-oxoacid:acceptor oxidoreductase family protein [Candidatus Hydrogenedentes bacterium]|nr:2-oxoacid:acceptor oxidoreductase family protein [Candidatus Hydrogenedentota bacterium]